MAWTCQANAQKRMQYKVFNEEMDSIRKQGRPRKMWLQSAEEDLKKMYIKTW